MRKVAVALSNGFGNHVAFHVIEPLDRILLSILGGGRIAAFNFRRLYGVLTQINCAGRALLFSI